MDDLKAELSALQDLFDKAERIIKEVEAFQGDLVIPAINELRYAGHHLLKALNAEGDRRAVEFVRCRSHCLRAIYEALDSGIVLALDRIRQFQEDYRKVVVADVVADYLQILQRAEDARQTLSTLRNHDDEDRSEDFDRLHSTFLSLRQDANHLELSRDEINKKIRQERLKFWINMAILVVSVITAVFTATTVLW